MTIDILVFGIVKEIAGKGSVSIQLNGNTTVAQLKDELVLLYPRIGQLSSFAVAVNGVYANNNIFLNAGDEVAIIPPVSGG